MSTTQCGFDPVTSVGPVCSGNGVCGNTTLFPTRAVCTCNEGWQGESDFQVTNSLLDCQINVVAIKVLWAVCLFIHLLVFLFSHFPKSKWLWKKHQAIVQRNKAAGKTYRLWDNKGLISLVPYLTIGWWSQTIFSIIKLVDQDLKIGSSVLVTVLYLCWRTTFFFAPCKRNLDHIIQRNKLLSKFQLLFSWSLSILLFIPMIVPQEMFNPVVGSVSFSVFCNLTALSLLSITIQAFYINKKVNAILVASYAISRDERTRKIMEKIAANQQAVVKGGFLQFAIYALFGCFPYLWNKHDYLVPFSWIATANQIRQALSSLVQEETDKSSSTRPTSPEIGSGQRKQIVVREAADSSVVESNKEPAIYGLDLDPMATYKSNVSSVAASEDDRAAEQAKANNKVYDSGVVVSVSPAMKVLRAFTPSRKNLTPSKKSQFTFEEGIGDNKGRQEDDDSRTEEY